MADDLASRGNRREGPEAVVKLSEAVAGADPIKKFIAGFPGPNSSPNDRGNEGDQHS
jgi:hypothetical protein